MSGLYLLPEAHPRSQTTTYGWGAVPHTTHDTHPPGDHLLLFHHPRPRLQYVPRHRVMTTTNSKYSSFATHFQVNTHTGTTSIPCCVPTHSNSARHGGRSFSTLWYNTMKTTQNSFIFTKKRACEVSKTHEFPWEASLVWPLSPT